MRILMTGDTHGNIGHVRHLLEVAKEHGCDRIMVCGDFGAWEHMPDGVRFMDKIDLSANMKNIPIYWVDGNHDKTSLVLEQYADAVDPEGFLLVRNYVRYACRGHRWTWGGVRFIALGGAYSVDKEWRLDQEKKGSGKPERYWFPEEQMTDAEMAMFLQDQDPVDVIVAHDKPLVSNPQWNRKDFVECLPNQVRLQEAVSVLKPDYFFHGHLHFPYIDMIPRHERDDGDGDLSSMAYVKVVGLMCDPEASGMSQYPAKGAWYIFDTEKTGVTNDNGVQRWTDPASESESAHEYWHQEIAVYEAERLQVAD